MENNDLARLHDDVFEALDVRLAPYDATYEREYPGDSLRRQPVHTVYVPADLFSASTCARWGAEALSLVGQHLGTAERRAELLGEDVPMAEPVWSRVRRKLAAEPIEDLRIDFEDGYGPRPDLEEEAAAVHAGRELAAAVTAGTAPPFVGIRFKSLEPSTRRRGVRTVDVFLGSLLQASGSLPAGFILTLPKVTRSDQVEAMTEVCAHLESAHGLVAGSLFFEIQIETPQAVIASDGVAAVAKMIQSAAGRCRGLHYGTYDYSTACGIAATYQSMEHPAADFAKAVMQVAAAGTGVHLSDGSTNVVPVGSEQAVLQAWQLHARLVRRSLERGYYQGWDLHPGHLPTRFAATYAFYARSFAVSASRLKAYTARQVGGFMDEPATAQALASFLVRGLNCGALVEAEVHGASGFTARELQALASRTVR